MSVVYCSIEYGSEENEDGFDVATTEATCEECDHTTMSYGDSDRSVRRCLALMREECPGGEDNYYMASGGENG